MSVCSNIWLFDFENKGPHSVWLVVSKMVIIYRWDDLTELYALTDVSAAQPGLVNLGAIKAKGPKYPSTPTEG